MKAIVTVMPKKSVLDPQGVAVRTAVHQLGLNEVDAIRIGKHLEIALSDTSDATLARLHEICRDLLSNPVIEDYHLEIVSDATQAI